MQDFHWIFRANFIWYHLWSFAFFPTLFDWIGSFRYGLTICYFYLQVCWFSRVESLYEALFFLLFRGMVDASGDQFVAYFLPTRETIGKRKRDLETEMDYTEDEEWVEVNSFKCSSVCMHYIELTFRIATKAFLIKWSLRNQRRNFILMKFHYAVSLSVVLRGQSEALPRSG